MKRYVTISTVIVAAFLSLLSVVGIIGRLNDRKLNVLLSQRFDSLDESITQLSTDLIDLEAELDQYRETTDDALYGMKQDQARLLRELTAVSGRMNRSFTDLRREQFALAEAMKNAGYTQVDPKEDLFLLSLVEKAEQRYNDEKYAEAAVLSADALNLAPEYIDALLYYGASLFRDNPADSTRYPHSKQSLLTVLQKAPDNVLALNTLAEIALEEQDWPGARQYYTRLIADSPETAHYYEMLVFAYRGEGRIEAAMTELEYLISVYPDSARYQYYCGEAAEKLAHHEKAYAYYQKSHTLDESYIPALTAAARTAYRLGRYTDAISYLDKPTVPKDFAHLTLYAECETGNGNIEMALEYWEKAAQTQNLNVPAERRRAAYCRQRMAELKLVTNEAESALEYAHAGSRLADTPGLKLVKGKSFLQLGNYNRARLELESLQKNHPESPEADRAHELLSSMGAADEL